ncbi:MAG: Metallopeptidase, partial [uncultured Actinomycetospora sp.]
APADRQRLLPPGHQRDLLPGRDPAAAVLQPRRGGGGELRRHRCRHRPRARPRLRRPGRAVRRRRQPPRLVDCGRQAGLRGQVAGAGEAVRRVRAPHPAGRARQRQPHRRREHRRPGRAHHRPQGVRHQPGWRGVAGGPAHPVPQLGARVAHEAAQGAGAPVPHHRPAQPRRVPRQHRAQPRRVPRGLRDAAGRRSLARARGPRPDLV